MDIATLGALGEFVGGLAVVVSLVAVGSWRRHCVPPGDTPPPRACNTPPPPVSRSGQRQLGRHHEPGVEKRLVP